jgi:predicted tellurium resistance membrane protein TerC
MQELHKIAFVEWIDDHWTVVLFCLTLAAFVAPFIVTDGFEHVWLVVPFAFAIVILPGLIATFLVDAAWRALTARRRRPAARRAQGDRRALRTT